MLRVGCYCVDGVHRPFSRGSTYLHVAGCKNMRVLQTVPQGGYGLGSLEWRITEPKGH